MTLNETLEQLSNACGVTGRENEVRELMIKLMKPYADEIVVDKLENVIAIKKGKSAALRYLQADRSREQRRTHLSARRWIARVSVSSHYSLSERC